MTHTKDRSSRRSPTTTLRLAVAAVIALSSIAFASDAARADGDTVTVDLIVVDDHGHLFPKGTAGAQACPVLSQSQNPVTCTSGWVANGDADGDGHVQLQVNPNIPYTFGAFAMNTGWSNPWIAPDGTEFHFSPVAELWPFQLEGAQHTFVVGKPNHAKPDETADVHVKVVDGSGNPFSVGTSVGIVTHCPLYSFDPIPFGMMCDPQLRFAQADARGNVRLHLQKGTSYDVVGVLVCDGPTYWLSNEAFVSVGAGMKHQPTKTFHINHACS